MAQKNAKDIQRAIVGVVTSRGNLAVPDIARRLGLRPHLVRYHLDQLVASKRVTLARLINHRAFDFQVVNVFFDLPRAGAKKGLEFLKGRPEVWWLTWNVGPRKYETTFVTRGHREYRQLLNALSAESGVHFRDPIVAFESEMRHWGLRFLADKPQREPPVYFKYPAESYELDAIDDKLLRFLRRASGMPVRDIARGIGIAQSTVTYRLERLREREAISEDLFFCNDGHDFVQAQLVLNLKVRTREHEQAVVDICARELYVEGLITGLGTWDYKIILRADTVNRLLEIEESLLGAIGKNVARHSMFIRNRLMLSRTE